MPISMSPAAAEASLRQWRNAISVGAANAFAQAVREASHDVPSLVRSLGESLGARALSRGKMQAINENIASQAQSAIVAGWRSRLPRGGRSGGALSGTLGAALESPQMTARTTDRMISFVNTEVLNQSAKHWYRINYGAIGANLLASGSQAPDTFTISIDHRPFLTLRDDLPPAQISYLPAAFFWEGDRLVATRGPARKSFAGARAAHFIDLGLEVVAREFPIAYDQFFRSFVSEGMGRARLAKRNITVIADIRQESYGYSVTRR